MSGALDLAVVGLGGHTALGSSVRTSVGAARAGLCAFQVHPFLLDLHGHPAVLADVSQLGPKTRIPTRMAALAGDAGDEALAVLPRGIRDGLPPVASILVLPTDRPGLSSPRVDQIAMHLSQRWRTSACVVERGGHAAGLRAVLMAQGLLARGKAELCLVVGVDSYVDAAVLTSLDGRRRLHSPSNPWGFVPGEAAGALLLTSHRQAARLSLALCASIVGAGEAKETNLAGSQSVCTGEGLATAIRQAVATLPPTERIDCVHSDGNGERYRVEEWGFCAGRLAERFVDASDCFTPADAWGDVGVATGPLLVAAAVLAAHRGYAMGPRSLVFAGSESGERTAVCLRAQVRPRWRA